MAIDICPACGYPKVGPGLCALCLPVVALTGDLTFGPTARRRRTGEQLPHVESPAVAHAG